MGIMRLLIGVIFTLITAISLAQPEDAVTKTIDGKKYYVHTVSEGNTLYGIHKLYNTDLEKILAANPGLSDDLKIGQQILVPIDLNDSKHFRIHVVSQGETLYGISRQYNLSVDELKKLNPGIEDGISIGQEIKVPNESGVTDEINVQNEEIDQPEYQISLSDSIVMHKVLDHETLYSISKRYMVSADTIMALNGLRNNRIKKGSVLKIPVKKVNYEVLEKDILTIQKDSSVQHINSGVKKEKYKVALLLPFMFAKNDLEMNKTLKFGQEREMYSVTKIAFEFYQGFKLAADSLAQAGLNVELFVFDTGRDTAKIGQLIRSKEFDDIDLVVGPLYRNTIKHAVDQCTSRGIKIVLPFKADPSVLHDNKNVFKAVSSNMTLMDGTVDYIVKNHAHHNVIILKPYSDGDKALYERAKARFNEKIKLVNSYNSSIVELSLGSSGGRDLNGYMKKDTANVVIVPSNDIKFVSGAMNRLNKVMNLNPYAKNLRIVVFGFEDWNKYDDIEVLHRNRLNQHYASYRFVDYNKDRGLDFVKAFRSETGTDPTVYSTQGFDIGMYFLSALHFYGTSFENSFDSYSMRLVQNDFKFLQIAPTSGFENTSVTIVRYENFELIECP